MKYELQITIELPRKRVIELFDNTDNLKKWQDGLQSFTPISGEVGKEGAKSKLEYKMGKREVEMIETITKRNLPEEFHGTYEANGVLNIQENYFTEVTPDKTLWTTKSEFRFQGLKKYFLSLMKSAFKQQTLKFMKAFKKFAEAET
jgi:hypothetical protein